MNYITTEIRDRIGYIILNRPEKRNALNADFVIELKECINSYEHNSEVRALVIKSSGEVFCAGIDLAYLQKLQNFTYEENLADSHNLSDLFKIIYSFPKPVISLVNGAALAGGCGLATICDMCFATPASTFGYTETRIGFIPAIVMVYLRKKLGESLNKKILFTGEIFKADKALEYGLITEIVEAETIETYVHEWVVKLIAGASGNSIGMLKQLYNSIDGLSHTEALDLACNLNAKTRETADCKRGVAAFLNKEKITW